MRKAERLAVAELALMLIGSCEPEDGAKMIAAARGALVKMGCNVLNTKPRITSGYPHDMQPSRFDLDAGRIGSGNRIELLTITGNVDSYQYHHTGRFGKLIEVLQDGDVDIELDDKQPPFQVKRRQLRLVP